MIRRSSCTIILAGLSCIYASPGDQNVPGAAPKEGPAPTHKQEVLWQKLGAAISRVDSELDAAMGVAIVDLTDDKQLLVAADEVFPIASSIKIAVLAELYRQSQQAAAGAPGKARLTDLYTMNEADLVDSSAIMAGLTPGVTRLTNRDLAVFMVAVSDNAATNVLIDRLGLDNVNRMLEGLGLKETRLRRKMMDLDAAKAGLENTSTPREMATLLEDIYRGKLLNPSLTADLLKVLGTPKESYIPSYLPEDLPVANKPGSLTGVRCDCGIVLVPGRPFIICVMTAFASDGKATEAAIGRVAEAAFRYFEIVGASSSYGRIL